MKKKFLLVFIAVVLILTVALTLGACKKKTEDNTPPATTEWTVSFDLNYQGAPAATTVKVKDGERVNKPEDPTRADHNFLGWYKDSACTTTFRFSTKGISSEKITADLTVYAKWESVDLPVPPEPNPIVSISATYNGGEVTADTVLNASDFTVTATRESGSTHEVEGFVIGEIQIDGNTASVEISYTEDGVTKTATVVLPLATVTPDPDKTLSYITVAYTGANLAIGGSVSDSDFVVTAYYDDNSHEMVTDFTISQIDTTTAGEKTVTVTYNGKTETVIVVVVGEDTPCFEHVDDDGDFVCDNCQATLDQPIPEGSYVLKGVDGDWETGIPMEANLGAVDGTTEYQVLGFEVTTQSAIKIHNTATEDQWFGFANLKEGVNAKFTSDVDGNIVLPVGKYDIYIEITAGEKCIWVSDYVPSEPDVFTVYFYNTDSWETVKAYAWNARLEAVAGAWPGSDMTPVEGRDGWFSIDVDRATYIIFNNGTVQTSDLEIDRENLYYLYNGTWRNTFEGELPNATCEHVDRDNDGVCDICDGPTGICALRGVNGDWTKGIAMAKVAGTEEYFINFTVTTATTVKVVYNGDWFGFEAVKTGEGMANVTASGDFGDILVPAGTYDLYFDATDGITARIWIAEAVGEQPDPDPEATPEFISVVYRGENPYVNDTLNPSDFVVTVVYTDGTEVKTTDFTIGEVDMTTAGEKEVVITAFQLTDSVTITVVERPVIETNTYYFYNKDAWASVYAYAWTSVSETSVPSVGDYVVMGIGGDWTSENAAILFASGNEYVYQGLALTEGDAIKIVRLGETEHQYFGAVESWVDSSLYTHDVDENIVISTTGVYDFYFKPSSGELYFATSSKEAVTPNVKVTSTHYLKDWPGTLMTPVEGQEGWFSIEIDVKAENVIFNNGAAVDCLQTPDLVLDPTTPFYNDGWSAGEGVCVHTYDNDCDADCNDCGETRIPPHNYAGDCDVDCDDCGEVREVETAHTPSADDHNCETAVVCTVCEVEITPANTHAFDYPCDKDCNNAGCEYTRNVDHDFSEGDCECGEPKPTTPVVLTGITVSPTEITDAVYGESIKNLLTVTATYEGKEDTVVTAFEISGFDNTKTDGAQEVTITYTEGEVTVSATISVTVVSPIEEGFFIWGIDGDSTKNVKMTLNTESSDTEYMALDVVISEDCEIKIQNTAEEDAWYGFSSVKAGVASSITEGENNKISLPAGTYNFYLALDGENPGLWIAEVVESEVFTVYAHNSKNWSTINAYAWGGNTSMVWPGVAMTPVEGQDGWYSIEVDAATSIIFNNGTDQTADLSIDKENPYYVIGNMAWQNGFEVTLVPDVVNYVLKGIDGDWTTGISMELNVDATDTEYQALNVVISTDSEIKIHEISSNSWYGIEVAKSGEGMANVSGAEGGNIIIAAGTYNFYFTVEGDNQGLWIALVECAHTYDNACDVDCNNCGAVRETEGHVPSESVADCTVDVVCTVCNAVITEGAEEHTYDNACDTTCNVEGCEAGDRETSHTPSEITDCTADVTCSVCNAVIAEGEAEHTYKDACDTTCEVENCQGTRVAPHNYAGDCDTVCNDCGNEREVDTAHSAPIINDCTLDVHCSICNALISEGKEDHVYSNACDKDCNNQDCTVTRTVEAHSYVDGACEYCGEPQPVEPVVLTGITATVKAGTYYFGDPITASNITVNKVMSDGTNPAVADVENISIQVKEGENTTVAGPVVYLATYMEHTAEFTVNFTAKLLSISVEPQKEYQEYNSELDIAVTAQYAGAEDKVVEDYEISGYDKTSVSTQEVTVTYTEGEIEVSATISVTVIRQKMGVFVDAIQDTALVLKHNQTTVTVAEILSCYTVVYNYDDGTTPAVDPSAIQISEVKSSTVGNEGSVTIVVDGKFTCEITALTVEKVQTGYTVAYAGADLKVGDEIALSDVVVTKVYSDDTTEVVEEGYTLGDYSNEEKGEVTVSVRVGEVAIGNIVVNFYDVTKLYFYNTEAWETVYAYTWTTVGAIGAPADGDYVIKGINNDWSTGLKMAKMADVESGYVFVKLTVNGTDGFKVDQLGKNLWCGNVGAAAEGVSYKHSADGNIILAEGTYTINYYTDTNTVTIKLYEESDGPCTAGTTVNQLGGWPGTAMTPVEGKAGWFEVVVDDSVANVIFNNNDGAQTDDLAVDVATPYYFDGQWYATEPCTHAYDGDCDSVCNLCDAVRETSKAHTPADVCATECSVCGEAVVPTHDYDGDCDSICNGCGAEREVETAHTPANACATACSICGEAVVPTHVYDGDCDSICNGCDAVREVETAHTPAVDDGNCTTAINCTVCGVQVVAPKTHVYTYDCTRECQNEGCNHVRTADHDYVDGSCSYCGAEDPGYVELTGISVTEKVEGVAIQLDHNGTVTSEQILAVYTILYTYDNGDTVAVAPTEITVTAVDSDVVGDTEGSIVITVGEFTHTFSDIKVNAIVTGITATYAGEAINVGEDIDASKLTVSKVLSDGSSVALTESEYTVGDYSTEEGGEVSVTVTYKANTTLTATFTFVVKDVKTVWFYNYAKWTTVNAYMWDSEDAENSYATAWPGAPMTKDGDTNWYSISVDASLDSIIFNDGTYQTDDLTIDFEKPYYAILGWSAEKSVDDIVVLDLTKNTNWPQADARFAVYTFGASGNAWTSLTGVAKQDGTFKYYAASLADLEFVPTNYIMCRMNPANATNDWSNKWNQTADLDISKKYCQINSGAWDNSQTISVL